MDALTRLWPHNKDDETTWKYSDFITAKDKNKTYIKEWVLNPDFKYKHLDPNYPQDTIKVY